MDKVDVGFFSIWGIICAVLSGICFFIGDLAYEEGDVHTLLGCSIGFVFLLILSLGFIYGSLHLQDEL